MPAKPRVKLVVTIILSTLTLLALLSAPRETGTQGRPDRRPIANGSVVPHCPVPMGSWSFPPLALAAMAVLLAVYLRRWRAVRRGTSRRGATEARLAAYVGGVAVLAVALVSPVDRLGEQLMVMHIVQHLLLIDVAPILLLLGLTKVLLRPVSRRLVALERRAGPLAHPAVGVIAYVVVSDAYLIPAVYDRVLGSEALHALSHALLFGAGTLYWWHLLSPVRQRLRLGILGPLAYMASAKLLAGVVPLVPAFSQTLLYEAYAGVAPVWGLVRLEDQRIAGLLMGLEQSIVMGVALAFLFVRALNDSERRELRAERLRDAEKRA